MKIFNVPSLRLSAVSATVLGLASIIRSASAIDDPQKPEVPCVPKQVQSSDIPKEKKVEELSPEQIEVSKVIKLAEEKNKGFDSLSDLIIDSQYEYSKNYKVILNTIPRDLNIKIAKRVFSEAAEALTKYSPDLAIKEKRSRILLSFLSDENAKAILSGAKDEYQKLIEAHINIFANPEKKIVYYDVCSGLQRFRHLIDIWKKDSLPQGVFNKNWYTKIEKIIENIDKGDESLFEKYKKFDIVSWNPKEELTEVLCYLGALEAQKNNGIENPKIFNKLIELVDKNPSKNWKDIMRVLIHYGLQGEAYINDNPKDIRVTQAGYNDYRIKADRKLIQSIEVRVKRIVSNLPKENATKDEKKLYKEASNTAATLAHSPYDRKDCMVAWHKPLLEKISKSTINEIPELLSDFKQNASSLYRELFHDGKEYFKLIIQAALKSLISDNPKENEKAEEVIKIIHQMYWALFPSAFSQDVDIKNSCLSVLKNVQNKKSEDGLIDFHGAINLLKISHHPEILKGVTNLLNAQIEKTAGAKAQAKNAKELKAIQEHEIKLIEAANLFTSQMPTEAKNDFLPWIENTSSLYKKLSGEIISKSSSSEVLNSAWELFKGVNRFPECGNPENKEMKKFINEISMNVLFKTLLESSNNLNKDDHASFRKTIYENITEVFSYQFALKNEFMIDGLLNAIREKCFDEKTLTEFNEFIKLVGRHSQFSRYGAYYNLRRAMLFRMIDLQKDSLQSAISQRSEDLKSGDRKVQLKAIEELFDFGNYVSWMQLLYRFPNENRVLENFISKEELQKTNRLIESNVQNISDLLLNNLANVKVTVERVPNGIENYIFDEVFTANINALDYICNGSELYQSKLLSIVDERLKTEPDPRNRGMLYQCLGKVLLLRNYDNKGILVLERFKSALAKEKSPITTNMVGEVLAEKAFCELLLEGKLVENYNPYKENLFSYTDFEKLSINIENFTEAIKKARAGEIVPREKTPAQNLVYTVTSASCGKSSTLIESLKDSYGYFNFKNLNGELLATSKDGELVNISKDVQRILMNSNSMLGGFGKRFIKETSDAKLITVLQRYGWTSGVDLRLKKALEEMATTIENNLWLNSLESLPHSTAALVRIYYDDENFNKKTEELNKKIFKGGTKFSLFEIYEENLLRNCISEHKKSFDNVNNFKKTTCGYLWNRLDRFGPIATDKTLSKLSATLAIAGNLLNIFAASVLLTDNLPDEKREEYNSLRKSLHDELLKTDSKLYSKTVMIPLQEAKTKTNFIRRFLEHAPSGRKEEYARILLDNFGFSDAELRRALGIE